LTHGARLGAGQEKGVGYRKLSYSLIYVNMAGLAWALPVERPWPTSGHGKNPQESFSLAPGPLDDHRWSRRFVNVEAAVRPIRLHTFLRGKEKDASS
jgi:hypothetical protein